MMNRLVRVIAQFSTPVQRRLLSTIQLTHLNQKIFAPPGSRQASSDSPDVQKRKGDADAILAAAVDASGPVSEEFYEEAATELSEEEILAKRNKSRLRDYHRRLIHGEIAHPEPKFWTHHTVKYKRRVYARHGEKSGINPGILWPTHDQLQHRLDYERVAYPFSFEEMVAAVKERRYLEKKAYEDRKADVEAKMLKVGKQIQEVIDKKTAKEREVRLAQERKAKLVEEVRRHFGYTVDPKDERFQQMIEKKEKEERKKLKEARKLEKQEKMLAKLAAQEKKGQDKEAKETKKAEEDAEKEP